MWRKKLRQRVIRRKTILWGNLKGIVRRTSKAGRYEQEAVEGGANDSNQEPEMPSDIGR